VLSTIPTFEIGKILRNMANSRGGSAPNGLLKGNAGKAAATVVSNFGFTMNKHILVILVREREINI